MQQFVVFLIFGGMGFMLLYVGCTQWWLQRRLMRHAVPVPARIVPSAVHSASRDDDDATTHRPALRFRYQCQGRSYESDMLHPTIIVHGGPGGGDTATGQLLNKPPGASVLAYVDPAHPDKGFLLPQASIGPAVFVLLGTLLPPLAWVIGGLL